MKFRTLTMPEIDAPGWLIRWSAQYDVDNGDDLKYQELIEKHPSFTAEDFHQIGMWKDGVSKGERETKYKENVAMVAFRIWEEAATQRPSYPSEEELSRFLTEWSTKRYTDTYRTGLTRTKQFGLSRATTLLHFISGGIHPIFDARVRRAIARLKGTKEMDYSLDAYFRDYLPAFQELLDLCKPRTPRDLDKALFSYGALDENTFRSASS